MKTLQKVKEMYFTLTHADIYTIVSHLGGIKVLIFTGVQMGSCGEEAAVDECCG